MLSIHLHSKDGDATPWFYEGSIADLFRTVRVVGERHAFVEISPSHLVNIAHIERIDEQRPDEDELAADVERIQVAAMTSPATPIPGGPPACRHGFIICEKCGWTEVGTVNTP